MNDADRREADHLRSLSSQAAATYLLATYPEHCPATLFHRSWRRPDQMRLARRCLQGVVPADGRLFEGFLGVMSVDLFLDVVAQGLPTVPANRLQLLAYTLLPVLKRAQMTAAQRGRADAFAAHLRALLVCPGAGRG